MGIILGALAGAAQGGSAALKDVYDHQQAEEAQQQLQELEQNKAMMLMDHQSAMQAQAAAALRANTTHDIDTAAAPIIERAMMQKVGDQYGLDNGDGTQDDSTRLQHFSQIDPADRDRVLSDPDVQLSAREIMAAKMQAAINSNHMAEAEGYAKILKDSIGNTNYGGETYDTLDGNPTVINANHSDDRADAYLLSAQGRNMGGQAKLNASDKLGENRLATQLNQDIESRRKEMMGLDVAISTARKADIPALVARKQALQDSIDSLRLQLPAARGDATNLPAAAAVAPADNTVSWDTLPKK